jgi:hypothetical protein
MSDTPYTTDIVAWSERQADALRRRAGNELDWDNLAAEVEDIGMGALQAVEGLLFQALAHRLKFMCWPDARDAERWQHDALNFLGQAQLHYRRAWHDRIDLQRIYESARRSLPETMYGAAPRPRPHLCPWTIEELLEP